jgi:hypothetical protein
MQTIRVAAGDDAVTFARRTDIPYQALVVERSTLRH